MQISTRGASSHQRITLPLDKAAVVQLDADARDVLVSNPDMVDAVVRTPRRIFLLATKVGQTNAFFFDASGKQILSLDIRVEKDVVDLASLMKATMPNSAIAVQAMNDNVVLTGQVASAHGSQPRRGSGGQLHRRPQEGRQHDRHRRRPAGDAEGPHRRNEPQHRQAVRRRPDGGGQDRRRAGAAQHRQSLRPAGPRPERSFRHPGRLGLYGQFFPTNTTSSASNLSTGDNTVTTITNGVASTVQTITTGAPSVNSALNSTGCTSQNNAQGVLKALEQVGLVHMLAEPNLTAVSGETAKFLAGGEFPVPVSRDRDGNITVEFKQFGVGLCFTPVVLSPGRISLQFSSEVSELTNTGAFNLGGAQYGPDHSGPVGAPRRRPRWNCRPAAASRSPA